MTEELPHRAQWTEMRARSIRWRRFWRKVGLWTLAFAVVIVAAFLLGPGH